MKAWVDRDESGRQRLTRQGAGRVSAVTRIDEACFLVEIDVDLPQARTWAIRYTAQAPVPADHPLLDDACAAVAWGHRVIWAIEWHAQAGIPDTVPIETLDLAREADARLVALTCLADEQTPVLLTSPGERA